MAEWGALDSESIAEARELIGVPLRRDRMQWVERATRDAIRQFCLGVGDDNPLWLEPEYAEATRWGQLLAPPSFLYAVDATIVAPKLPGVQWIYAGTRWRWFDLIRVNDLFETSALLTGLEEKCGKRFPSWVLQTGEVTYRRAGGPVVATAEGRIARTPRASAEEPGTEQRQEAARGRASAAPRPDAGLAQVPPRLGCRARAWESVTLGDEVGPLTRTLQLDDVFRWYAGAQGALHYGGAHGDAVRYRRRHDDFEINRDTGAKDAAARGHFSNRVGVRAGMGGAYDVGPHRISWLIAMLTDWIGDGGFLAELAVDVLRPNLVGDTTRLFGEVVGTWRAEHCVVSIELRGRNQREEETTRGSALVVLPSDQGGEVALPILGGDPGRRLSRVER